jgi:two-component system chemotaxis response regulator CheY
MASILLIDDDENLLIMTSMLLQAEGHMVTSAMNGEAGLATYNSGQFDLVITDIVMPELNGLQLIEELRYASPRPRVIAMSGGSEFSKGVYLPFAKDLGVDRILAKPLLHDTFLRTVIDVLGQPRQATMPRARP